MWLGGDTTPDDVDADNVNDRGENARESLFLIGEARCKISACPSSYNAATNEEREQLPVDEAGECIVSGRRETKR